MAVWALQRLAEPEAWGEAKRRRAAREPDADVRAEWDAPRLLTKPVAFSARPGSASPVGRPSLGSPRRMISQSSVTPLRLATRARTVSPSRSMSSAEALPSLIRKLQCISETLAPPTRRPRQPAASISFQALCARRVLEGGAAGALLDRLVGLAILGHLLHLLVDLGRLAGVPWNSASVKIQSPGTPQWR